MSHSKPMTSQVSAESGTEHGAARDVVSMGGLCLLNGDSGEVLGSTAAKVRILTLAGLCVAKRRAAAESALFRCSCRTQVHDRRGNCTKAQKSEAEQIGSLDVDFRTAGKARLRMRP